MYEQGQRYIHRGCITLIMTPFSVHMRSAQPMLRTLTLGKMRVAILLGGVL